MKKKTVSLLLVAAMAVGMLAGCGGGKSSISQDGSSDAAEGSEKAEAVFEKNSTLIGGEVLATEVVKAEPAGHVKEWKINGEAVTMGVEKKGE